jgi:hypothetical protein
MRRVHYPLVAVLALGLPACDPPEEPTFCAVRADLFEPENLSPEECRKHHDSPLRLRDDEGFFVLHQLPDDVAVDVPLKVTFTTPCARTSSEHRHARGSGGDARSSRVLFAARAPAGASCSLTIEASILNSTDAIVTLPVDAESCSAVGGSCPDGGTDAGG